MSLEARKANLVQTVRLLSEALLHLQLAANHFQQTGDTASEQETQRLVEQTKALRDRAIDGYELAKKTLGSSS